MNSSNRDLSTLENQKFDVLIVGGGISGAWLALHCSQQGLKTALIEKHDYASQTSSSSSKLLHGGIRYLQQMQFGKVRESAMERAEYMFAAPHLSAAVPFVIPTYKDFQRSKFFLNCGMLAYRVLSLGENRIIDSSEQHLPAIRSLSAAELNEICDLGDEPHTGGVVFHERHMLDSERMVLAILQTAQGFGAQTFNYVSAEDFIISNNTVTGVNARDELTGNTLHINSELLINAAGPWVDNLNKTIAVTDRTPCINGFAIGSHIITRQLADHAIALTTKHQSDAKIDRGGRHVFVIPWRGYSLIGTSYEEVDNPNRDIKITSEHVEQLIEAINDAMPSASLTRDDLVAGYSGLHLLHTDDIKSSVYQGSGEYRIIDHASSNGINGLVTALGAKFTTGRKLSELTMKVVNAKLGRINQLSRVKLSGSHYQSLTEFTEQKISEYQHKLSADTIRHLVMHYGSSLDQFMARIGDDEHLTNPVCEHQHDIFGQIVWAIEHEQAQTIDDILFNRTSLGLLGINLEEVNTVANLMAESLGWSEKECAQQVRSISDKLQATHSALHNTLNNE